MADIESPPPPPEHPHETSHGAPPGAPTGPPSRDPTDHLMNQLRRLRRSRHHSVFAGVCGGLARSLGVDPLLIRVVAAVLVLFGGAGLALYATAWLVLPVDDGSPSVGSQVMDRTRHRPSTETKLLAVFLAVVITSGAIGLLKVWHGPVLVSVVVIATLLVLQRRPVPGDPAPGTPAAAATPVQDQVQGPAQGPAQGLTQPVGPAPAPYLPPPPRSMLFGATASVVVIAWGVLATADVVHYDVPVTAYPALGLGVTGLGLLVGAWHGRARWLILWGLVLALLLAPATVVDKAATVSGPTFNGTKVVDELSDLPRHARFESGQVEYDLRNLDLAGRTGSMDVRMGFGEVVVLVPDDVDVTVRASASTGGLTLFGSETGGLGPRLDRTDVGADGPGGGTLDITLYAGIGHLEVRRATS